MGQISLVVEHNDNIFIEIQELDGIDHVIKIVTDVAHWLSQENNTPQENDVATES